ncbi:MAG TPA: bifunctional metallophosphatase/5'-nucleotidase [Desulfosporosinus sp.]|nr:bifunctional metallophosphatase/5'-nucleotidase [Desulfosporosinus sp.]
MKTKLRFVFFVITISLLLGSTHKLTAADTAETGKTMTLLFTHDLHDHFRPFRINHNGTVKEFGGYARLQTAINQEKELEPELLLVDGGDFSMGTLFQSIYASDAPQLRIMGQLGYDVVTLGNHEFDFRANGLAESLKTAKKSGDKLPQIVISNLSYPSDKEGNLSESLSNLKQSALDYGVKDYTVIERNGVKVGVFGLLGRDAASKAPMSEVEFTDTIENAKRVANQLKKEEQVDLVVCLSHLGTWADKSDSEDEILAEEVPEINVIISAHTHSKLTEPILVGKTIIGSTGEYGENLGVLKISQDSQSAWKLDRYTLKQIDKGFNLDPDITKMIDDFQDKVQETYLDNFGMKFNEILANSPFDFVATSEIGSKHAEDTLGNLISDAFIHAVKQAEGADYDPIAVAIVPSGTLRSSFLQGNITVADTFAVSSLGVGKDGISGYPLIAVYLTGKELKTACEVDASIAPIMDDAQLYMSGLNFSFNPNRLIFNKVTQATLQKPDGMVQEIDDQELYRVVASLYTAQMLSVVGDKSLGLLSIVPKTKDCNPITDFEAQIITDKVNGRNNEIKEWLATAEYLKSFDKVAGVAQIPQYYKEIQGRKLVEHNNNVLALLSKPNSIALVVYTFVILGSIGIVVIIKYLIKRLKHKNNMLRKI